MFRAFAARNVNRNCSMRTYVRAKPTTRRELKGKEKLAALRNIDEVDKFMDEDGDAIPGKEKEHEALNDEVDTYEMADDINWETVAKNGKLVNSAHLIRIYKVTPKT
mmetsp:Transcript_1248/g.1415  ORF Transcript_1248/g.1415 Transcript_1248/m.1415 type:complete len:107 (+) Transcript_1248:34-354(+)